MRIITPCKLGDGDLSWCLHLVVELDINKHAFKDGPDSSMTCGLNPS